MPAGLAYGQFQWALLVMPIERSFHCGNQWPAKSCECVQLRLSNLALLQPSLMGCCRDLAKNSPSPEQFALAFVIRDKSVSLLFDNALPFKQQLF